MTARPSETTVWLSAATVVATIATAGSLWFSLGLGLTPCDLCWYQRILMYPLVVVFSVATVEKRPAVLRTALPLVGLGLSLAAYHSYLQATMTECTLGGRVRPFCGRARGSGSRSRTSRSSPSG